MLRSDTVYLRRLERGDLDRTHEWINRPDIYEVMGVFGPRSKEQQEQWFEANASSKTNLVFAVCLAADDTHIGNASLFDIDYVNNNAGLTIFIAEEEHRGRGHGTEAVRLLCEYAFTYLNLHRVYCKTDNSVAGALYESLGFKHEGVMREHAYRQGSYISKDLYGLLRSETKWTEAER